MTDSTGAVVWSADYKPFGEATITVSTITNNLRFPGQYYDAETGLNYNYYRDYNPVIGRYIEADPIGLRGGVNLYAYVGSNPINFIDPSGLCVAGCVGDAIIIEQMLQAIVLLLAYEVAKDIPKPKDEPICRDPNDCEKLIQQIRNHIQGMKGKYNDLIEDKYRLYDRARTTNPGGELAGMGTWQGHVDRYKGLVEGLKNLVIKALNLKCKIPDDVVNEIEQLYKSTAPTKPSAK